MFGFLLFGLHDIKDKSGIGDSGPPWLPAEGLVGPVADDGSTVDWITSLRSQTIRKLMNEGPLQLSQFNE